MIISYCYHCGLRREVRRVDPHLAYLFLCEPCHQTRLQRIYTGLVHA